jgi:hypothetical protein
MYIGMSNDFYRPTKIASCAPGFSFRHLQVAPLPRIPASDRHGFKMCLQTAVFSPVVQSNSGVTLLF